MACARRSTALVFTRTSSTHSRFNGTPVFGVDRSWANVDVDALWGPSVHWNTYLNAYVTLLNRGPAGCQLGDAQADVLARAVVLLLAGGGLVSAQSGRPPLMVASA